jgi:hypothetical protein
LRERATAAEGGTHVYLNSKMKHEFTLILAEIGIPRHFWQSSFLTRPVVTDASFHLCKHLN